VEDSTIELGNAILLRHRSTYQIHFDDEVRERQRPVPALAIVQFISELKSRWTPHEDPGFGDIMELRLSGTRTKVSRPKVVTGIEIRNENETARGTDVAEHTLEEPVESRADDIVTAPKEEPAVAKAEVLQSSNNVGEEAFSHRESLKIVPVQPPMSVEDADSERVSEHTEHAAQSGESSAETVPNPAPIVVSKSANAEPFAETTAVPQVFATPVAKDEDHDALVMMPAPISRHAEIRSVEAPWTSDVQEPAAKANAATITRTELRSFTPLTPRIETSAPNEVAPEVTATQVITAKSHSRTQPVDAMRATPNATESVAGEVRVAVSKQIKQTDAPSTIDRRFGPTEVIHQEQVQRAGASNDDQVHVAPHRFGADRIHEQRDATVTVVSPDAPQRQLDAEMSHVHPPQVAPHSEIEVLPSTERATINSHAVTESRARELDNQAARPELDDEVIAAQVLRQFARELELEAERRGMVAWDY
jgi:hypothetical protein